MQVRDWEAEVCQRGLIGIPNILCAQAIEGEPPPSTIVIVLKPNQIDLYRDHLSLVSAKSNSLFDDPLKQLKTSLIKQHLSFHLRHLGYTRKNSRVMPNITYGITPTFGDYAVTRLSASAFLLSRSIQSSSSATQHLEYYF
ncbi:hypothetical protein CR513_05959, partial [Mucuna pruriens]